MLGFKRQDWTQRRPHKHQLALNHIFTECKDLCPYRQRLKESFHVAVNEVVIRCASEMEQFHDGGFRMFDTCLFVLSARVLCEAGAESKHDERRTHREGHRNLT